MRALLRVALIVLLTLLGLVVLWRFRTVIALFVIALFITVSLQPLVDRLRAWRIPASIAMLLIYLLGSGLLVGAAILAFPILSQEVQQLLADLNASYRAIYSRMTENSMMSEAALSTLPAPASFPTILPGLQRQQITQFLIGTTTGVVDAASQIVLLVFLSIYLVVDQVRFERLWLSVVSPIQRTAARQIYHEIAESIGMYIRSETAQSALALLVLSGLYQIIGLKYALFSAIVVAVVWAFPLLGGPIALVWVGLAGWLTNLQVMLAALLITGMLLAFLEFWLQPRLYRRDRFGTILVLVTMMILGRGFGLAGLLIAPPLATAIQVLINSLLRLPGPGANILPEMNSGRLTPAAIEDEWQEIDQRLENLRQTIEKDSVPASTADLFKRLTEMAAKTRLELKDENERA